LWDVADPARPRRLGAPLTGHTGPVSSVAFTGDGRTLATGSYDRTVILWDVADPARPRRLGDSLTGHTGFVYSVAFTGDGRTLATGSFDSTVILWDVSVLNRLREDVVALACQRAGRGLTSAEWTTYIPDLPYQPTC
jgi:WD40 repeat protein